MENDRCDGGWLRDQTDRWALAKENCGAYPRFIQPTRPHHGQPNAYERPMARRRADESVEPAAGISQPPPLQVATKPAAQMNAPGQESYGIRDPSLSHVRSADRGYDDSLAKRVPPRRSGKNSETHRPFQNSAQPVPRPGTSRQPGMGIVSDQNLERLGDAACVEEALLQVITRAISSFKARHQEYLCRRGGSAECYPYPTVF